MAGLVERLGFPADARVVILTCDDLGSSHSANVAIFEALNIGTATSASLMVPCPWAREAASIYRDEDVGVHLTLNAEHETYRWGPMTKAPSLSDPDGSFHRTIEHVWEYAELSEVRTECRTQIERALAWGVDVTHLDSHIGHMIQRKPEFFDIYIDLAVEFRLPVRLTGENTQEWIGFPFRRIAETAGVIGPDSLIVVPDGNGVGSRRTFSKMIPLLKPGVHEMYVHPAVDSTELRSMTADWESRADDYAMTVHESWLAGTLESSGITLIGYRRLRELMRSE